MAVQRVVVMGVAGAGKTTIGELLAEQLGARFVDADDLHPPANVAKMAAGTPLDDRDRAPWLRRVRDELAGRAPVVVTCSALKRAHRDVIRDRVDATFVFLDVEREVVDRRVAERSGHFMKSEMVASQFDTLERPTVDESDVITIDADREPAAVVGVTVDRLGARHEVGRYGRNRSKSPPRK